MLSCSVLLTKADGVPEVARNPAGIHGLWRWAAIFAVLSYSLGALLIYLTELCYNFIRIFTGTGNVIALGLMGELIIASNSSYGRKSS